MKAHSQDDQRSHDQHRLVMLRSNAPAHREPVFQYRGSFGWELFAAQRHQK